MIIAFLSTYSQTANAQNVDAKAAANRTSIIYSYVLYNSENCAAAALPKVKIKSEKNGKIVGIKGSFKLTKGPCKGKRMKGIGFKYTPNRGFRGMDKASVLLTMPSRVDDSGNMSKTLNFSIQVK